MKQYWQQLQQKIDALTLRERALAFAAAAFVLVTLINTLLLDPLFVQQKKLSERVSQEQQLIAALQTEIQKKVQDSNLDPDAPNRERLHMLRQQISQANNDLMAMQKGLVPPERMSGLLEDLLRRNGRLQLLSLKTLPVAAVQEAVQQDAKPTGSPAAVNGMAKADPATEQMSGAVYKHGVEIVVQGSYSDMMNYLTQLEDTPWQLFWSSARLKADTYPKATLTMTIFTISLDKTWLNI